MARTALGSLWEGWSGQNLATAQQGDLPDNRAETRQTLNVLLDYINSAENTLTRVRSKERIANLKAQQSRQNKLSDLQAEMVKLEGDLTETKLNALVDLTQQSMKSWTDYLSETGEAYSAVTTRFKGMIANAGASSAWKDALGGIDTEPNRVMDRQSFKFASTFRQLNTISKVVDFNDDGTIPVDSNNNPIIEASGLDPITQRAIRDAALDYNALMGRQSLILGRFNAVENTINQASTELATNGVTERAKQLFNDARSGLKKSDAQAAADLKILDADSLQREIAEIEEENELLLTAKDRAETLMDQITNGQTRDWTRLVTTKKFQQWAEDRGISVGYKAANGKYVPGPNDELAVAKWANESNKQAGDYGLLLNRFTDEIVQVTDKQGNIVARGFRQPVHANDREGQVRVMIEGGQSQVFDPGDIGEVQVIMTYPGGRRRLGSTIRRRNMADALAYLGVYGDLDATKPSEEISPGTFATRDGIDGVSYLTKDEYNRALKQSDVEVGRFVIDQEQRKTYVRFGDEVFDYNMADGSVSKVTEDDVVKRVVGLPSSIAVKEDETVLLYGDVSKKVAGKEGEQLENNIGKIGRTKGDEETADYLERGRRQFLKSQGVKLTQKAKKIVSGETRDIMGVTFRDAKFPTPSEAEIKTKIKPGDDPFDTGKKETGAVPVSAVKVRKGDAGLMRDILRGRKPKPPARAKDAASSIRPGFFPFKRDPDSKLDDDPDEGASQFKDRAESRAARKEARREKLQGKVDEAMDVLSQRSMESQTTGTFDPADTEAIKALKKKRRAERKLDRMGTPVSPTPENAQGQTDLNTGKEVKSAATGPTKIQIDPDIKEQLDETREKRKRQAERDAAKAKREAAEGND